MEINATIIGQFITFVILVWFTMRYVWPPIVQTLHEREKKIAAGLETAERSKRELEAAEHKALSIIREAKLQASQIVEQANLHSAQLIEQAKIAAKQENSRLSELAQADIQREMNQAKEILRAQLVKLAVAGAEKLIQRQLDSATHQELLHGLVAEI